ncbi:universal stress protein [Melioribacter sp. OK-6-Me]|uniref:universal stress protein n=1 Tax=unclassified Melioribacter TaxID=2627329 RepID=UPI003EDB4020
MFKKILLATDISKASDAVISCGNLLKNLGAEEVILFYALGVRHIESLKNLLKDIAEPDLLRQKKMLEDQGLNVKLEIAPGIPSEEINKYAETKDVSLIVIGTHGETAAQHILFRIGGVTSEILHSHKKPLLVVRTFVTEKNGEKCVEATCANFAKRILYPTDFSDTAFRAFTYLEKLVEYGAKKITLMHVQDKTKIDKHLKDKLDEFNKIDMERLEMRKKALIEKGATNVEIKITYGIPTKEILEEAKKDYSLIVMGSQGRGFVEEIFVGSVSHNVVRNANISVLLIPALR